MFAKQEVRGVRGKQDHTDAPHDAFAGGLPYETELVGGSVKGDALLGDAPPGPSKGGPDEGAQYSPVLSSSLSKRPRLPFNPTASSRSKRPRTAFSLNAAQAPPPIRGNSLNSLRSISSLAAKSFVSAAESLLSLNVFPPDFPGLDDEVLHPPSRRSQRVEAQTAASADESTTSATSEKALRRGRRLCEDAALNLDRLQVECCQPPFMTLLKERANLNKTPICIDILGIEHEHLSEVLGLLSIVVCKPEGPPLQEFSIRKSTGLLTLVDTTAKGDVPKETVFIKNSICQHKRLPNRFLFVLQAERKQGVKDVAINFNIRGKTELTLHLFVGSKPNTKYLSKKNAHRMRTLGDKVNAALLGLRKAFEEGTELPYVEPKMFYGLLPLSQYQETALMKVARIPGLKNSQVEENDDLEGLAVHPPRDRDDSACGPLDLREPNSSPVLSQYNRPHVDEDVEGFWKVILARLSEQFRYIREFGKRLEEDQEAIDRQLERLHRDRRRYEKEREGIEQYQKFIREKMIAAGASKFLTSL